MGVRGSRGEARPIPIQGSHDLRKRLSAQYSAFEGIGRAVEAAL